MQLVEQLLLNLGFFKKPTPAIIDFAEIARLIHFKLPEDYKFYLSNFAGMEDAIGPEYFCLWDSTEILQANKEYSIFDNLTDTLGIGSNMGGEFIGIECTSAASYRIILSPLIDLDAQAHLEIGSSFTDFLARLANGQTWFGDDE